VYIINIALFFKSRSIYICQTRLLQSGEKERADLFGHSGRGHLVLVCAERCRPRPLLKVNKLCRRLSAQIGVATSDFSQMHRNRSEFDHECGVFRSDWSGSI